MEGRFFIAKESFNFVSHWTANEKALASYILFKEIYKYKKTIEKIGCESLQDVAHNILVEIINSYKKQENKKNFNFGFI